MNFEGEPLACSFCGKGQEEVKILIWGPDVGICDECVKLCVDICFDKMRAPKSTKQPSKETLSNS